MNENQVQQANRKYDKGKNPVENIPNIYFIFHKLLIKWVIGFDKHIILNQLTSSERSSENSHGQFRPNKEENEQNRTTDKNSILDAFYISQDKFAEQTRAEQEDSHDDKVEQVPIYFVREMHCDQWNEH